MSEILLKNNQKLIIRHAKIKDAAQIIQYGNEIGGESNNLGYGKGEYPFSLEHLKNNLAASKNNKNFLLTVGLIDEILVSAGSMAGHSGNRNQHIADLGISVRKQYWRLGIGAAMINFMIDWAKTNKFFKRINIEVKADNENGIKLYEKCGFIYEGLIHRGIKIGDQFYDMMVMGLLLD
jgi:RimJ/RimL family protein N-acetyltransferase